MFSMLVRIGMMLSPLYLKLIVLVILILIVQLLIIPITILLLNYVAIIKGIITARCPLDNEANRLTKGCVAFTNIYVAGVGDVDDIVRVCSCFISDASLVTWQCMHFSGLMIH